MGITFTQATIDAFHRAGTCPRCGDRLQQKDAVVACGRCGYFSAVPVTAGKVRVTFTCHRYSDRSDPGWTRTRTFTVAADPDKDNAQDAVRDTFHAWRAGCDGRESKSHVGGITGAEFV